MQQISVYIYVYMIHYQHKENCEYNFSYCDRIEIIMLRLLFFRSQDFIVHSFDFAAMDPGVYKIAKKKRCG